MLYGWAVFVSRAGMCGGLVWVFGLVGLGAESGVHVSGVHGSGVYTG